MPTAEVNRDDLLNEKKNIEILLRQYRGRLDFGDDSESTDSYEEEADEAEEYANFLGVKKVLEERLKAIEKKLQSLGSA